jgi:hypothetical protein
MYADRVANVAHINREAPPIAKPKEQSIPETRKKDISLGAGGPKKGTRRCGSCGYYATHNSRTCLKLTHNKARPEDAEQDKRQATRSTEQEEHNVPQSTGDKELPTDKYISTDSDSDDDEFNDMDAED